MRAAEAPCERVHAVITGAKSRSHLIYIASYLRHVLDGLPSTGRVRVSFIPAPAFLATHAVGLDDARELFPDDARLSVHEGMARWRFEADSDAHYISVGAPGLKAMLELRRANGPLRIRVVVTDEGIGTYGGLRARRDAMRRQGAHPVTATLKAALLVGAAKTLTSRRWAAYRRVGGAWHVVPEVAEEFARHVGGTGHGARRTAVILTQPFVDLGLVSEGDYLTYVRAIVQQCADAGFVAVVRPHPSEDVRRYERFEVMAGRGTAELDSLVTGADVVLGGPSTALVNLAAMFDTHVVWVSEPSLTYLDTDVSAAQAEIFATFLGRPVSTGDLARHLVPAR